MKITALKHYFERSSQILLKSAVDETGSDGLELGVVGERKVGGLA